MELDSGFDKSSAIAADSPVVAALPLLTAWTIPGKSSPSRDLLESCRSPTFESGLAVPVHARLKKKGLSSAIH